MNSFDAKGLTKRYGEMYVVEARARDSVADNTLWVGGHSNLEHILEKAVAVVAIPGFEDAATELQRLIKVSKRDKPNGDALAQIAESARNAIHKEYDKRKFLYVAPDRSGYVDQDRLFGDRVHEGFAKARGDIREAGNCLAVECSTAAVFHLMRVAEYGIRALAYDRRITVLPKDKPIDLGTWEDLLKELEKAETAIQGFRKTHAREKQYEFYHGAMMELRSFKNMFRNRVMHTRESFDRDQARSAYTHVRAFMVLLSSRIAEGKRTPKVWTDRWLKTADASSRSRPIEPGEGMNQQP